MKADVRVQNWGILNQLVKCQNLHICLISLSIINLEMWYFAEVFSLMICLFFILLYLAKSSLVCTIRPAVECESTTIWLLWFTPTKRQYSIGPNLSLCSSHLCYFGMQCYGYMFYALCILIPWMNRTDIFLKPPPPQSLITVQYRFLSVHMDYNLYHWWFTNT